MMACISFPCCDLGVGQMSLVVWVVLVSCLPSLLASFSLPPSVHGSLASAKQWWGKVGWQHWQLMKMVSSYFRQNSISTHRTRVWHWNGIEVPNMPYQLFQICQFQSQLLFFWNRHPILRITFTVTLRGYIFINQNTFFEKGELENSPFFGRYGFLIK